MTSTISFLSETMKYIAKLNAGEAHECIICLGDCPPEAVSVTRCGHLFCTECITSFVRSGKTECPNCRERIEKQDFDPIAILAKDVNRGSVDCARYGTKIASIISELRRIHSED